eukprot:Lankesteria_metandrocarpae@DN7131_c0_g1_i1.p1
MYGRPAPRTRSSHPQPQPEPQQLTTGAVVPSATSSFGALAESVFGLLGAASTNNDETQGDGDTVAQVKNSIDPTSAFATLGRPPPRRRSQSPCATNTNSPVNEEMANVAPPVQTATGGGGAAVVGSAVVGTATGAVVAGPSTGANTIAAGGTGAHVSPVHSAVVPPVGLVGGVTAVAAIQQKQKQELQEGLSSDLSDRSSDRHHSGDTPTPPLYVGSAKKVCAGTSNSENVNVPQIVGGGKPTMANVGVLVQGSSYSNSSDDDSHSVDEYYGAKRRPYNPAAYILGSAPIESVAGEATLTTPAPKIGPAPGTSGTAGAV